MVEEVENYQSSDVIYLNSPSRLLSICMFGSDDEDMLDFRYRITTTINYLARSIQKHGTRGLKSAEQHKYTDKVAWRRKNGQISY